MTVSELSVNEWGGQLRVLLNIITVDMIGPRSNVSNVYLVHIETSALHWTSFHPAALTTSDTLSFVNRLLLGGP